MSFVIPYVFRGMLQFVPFDMSYTWFLDFTSFMLLLLTIKQLFKSTNSKTKQLLAKYRKLPLVKTLLK